MPSTSVPENRKARKLDEGTFVAFGHAAAGHDGVLCNPSGSLIAKPCTPQEIEFYESSLHHPGFQQFMPRFIGTLSSATAPDVLEIPISETRTSVATAAVDPLVSSSSSTDTPVTPELSRTSNLVTVPVPVATHKEPEWFPSQGKKINSSVSIVLENVAAGFKRPSVLDVKLGARLWADDATPAKRAKLDQVSLETTSAVLGFRIAGMKIWVGENAEKAEKVLGTTQTKTHDIIISKQIVVETVDGYRRYDKWYGRSFNADNVKEGFKTFLAGAKAGKVDRSKLIANRIAESLRAMQAVLEVEESRMYSASVLIVYEGDPEALEEALVKEADTKEQGNNDSKADDRLESESESESEYDVELPEGSSTLQIVDVKVDGESITQSGIKLDISPNNLGDIDFDIEGGEDEDEDEDEIPHKVHDIRLIDFAHAQWTPGQGPDENAVLGIRNLVSIMDELAEA
ncbi:arginine metabolism regulation protein III [Histoplasma capsulatum G186AR]|uniref:Kinase n=2 Tax=Ajellomyces capsulatus TaxID=5037 RepID=C0NNV5_AJECG|nr:arginine metabolism regulation protein III [Histoplasma capsulatum G186AR]EEH06615.1 arginine metabolism regulation protein III [Histoplasma capsulatum G186AR]KAG5304855.1 arginine metabolism regulation protein III [Histoplasma capsulatum]QSS75814.1 arginine metabolism regulation protein III [Histoplasma capsulatum G186AR]